MKKTILLSAACVLAAIAPVLGHHAFGGEFDPNKPVLLKGKITTIEWVNPHAWIHLEIPKADATTPCQYTPNAKCEEWMVEGGTPNTLLRRGITKESLTKGTGSLSELRRSEEVPVEVGHRRTQRKRSAGRVQSARAASHASTPVRSACRSSAPSPSGSNR